jgi:hypothetical protein
MGRSQAIVFRIGLARRFQLKADWQTATLFAVCAAAVRVFFIRLSSAQRNAPLIGGVKPDKTAQAAPDQVLG